jgi:nitroimidazol reductase NimA-like FMN-containing flavoprotein (pyridoxamine 5'-phosphate oxidase superfamily)
MSEYSFDVDAFLAEPRVAQLATNGPTLRTVDYIWEDGCFWVPTGPWAKLLTFIQRDPKVVLVVDTCDYDTGRIYQVVAAGEVEIEPGPFDVERERRTLARYMGPDESKWSTSPTNYPAMIKDGGPPGAVWLKLRPKRFRAHNFSYSRSRYGSDKPEAGHKDLTQGK